MLTMNLDPETEEQVTELAQSKEVSLKAMVRDALIDVIEEAEDIALLDEAYADPEAGQTRSLHQVARELGLAA